MKRKPYHDPNLRRDKEGRLWITFYRAPEAKPKLTDRALKAASQGPEEWGRKP